MLNAERLAAEGKRQIDKWLPDPELPMWEDIKTQAADPANYISGVADDHWNRYEEDLDLAKSLGLTAYRFSLEWSRIEPEEGKFDAAAIAHYQKMIDAMHARGIEPWVTLWHWVVPLWFEDAGGWTSPAAPAKFARFADHVGRQLNGVKFWMTLNEPNVYTSLSYLMGSWPPQKHNPLLTLRVRRQLQTGHRLAYQALKAIDPNFQIGLTDQIACKVGLDPVGKLIAAAGNWLDEYHFRHGRRYLDFVGLQHYQYIKLKGWKQVTDGLFRADIGWWQGGESLAIVARQVAKFGRPIYVTEHGVADAHDRVRGEYIAESLRGLQAGIADGVDVRGYLHWSLLDNFEWAYGFWPRFGLIEVDRQTLRRTVRPSARRYAQIIKANAV